VTYALVGRAMTGLGGPRGINRRYIADTASVESRTSVSAAFVACGALGMAVGPGLAVFLEVRRIGAKESKGAGSEATMRLAKASEARQAPDTLWVFRRAKRARGASLWGLRAQRRYRVRSVAATSSDALFLRWIATSRRCHSTSSLTRTYPSWGTCNSTA
jgi:hypothetical protein